MATVTRHEWLHARRRRTCYARSSALHAHSHKTRRSSFLSSSLSKPWFASALTLHASFSKEALGLSPAFSPAAVKPLSPLFLPPEPNILLGKHGLLWGWGGANGVPPPRFFFCCCSPLFLSLCLHQAGPYCHTGGEKSSAKRAHFDRSGADIKSDNVGVE